MDMSVITSILSTMTSAANSMSGNLLGEGKSLLMALTGAMATYYVVMSLIGTDFSETIMDLGNLVLKWAVVTIMFASWSGMIQGTFVGGFNSIASSAAGQGATLSEALNLGTKAIKSVWGLEEGGSGDCVNDPVNGSAGCGDKTEAPEQELGITEGFQAAIAKFADIPAKIAGFILKMVATVFLLLMMIAFIIVGLLGVFMVGVGLTVGPILVPFLVFSPMSYLFDGWLKFMIAGGLTKVVAAVVFTIAGTTMSGLSSLKIDSANPMGVDVLAALAMCLVAAIGTFVMWQVPDFAGQLMSGGSGAKASGFGKGAAGKGISKGVGNAASGGASKLLGFLKGGK